VTLAAGTAVVTGADRGLGWAMTKSLAERGWTVFAGRFLSDWPGLDELVGDHPEHVVPVALDVSNLDSCAGAARAVGEQVDSVDLLINNAGINSLDRESSIRDGLDYDELHRLFDVNSLGALRMVQCFLPLLDAGTTRRLGFVSSEAGSITRARRTAWYNYSMSKAALNMGVRVMFNHLRPEGYSFRVYHPGFIRSWIGGSGHQGTRGGMEPEVAAEPALRYFLGAVEDEEVLVMGDNKGEIWPW
jgi:NAD(P)-dependent dehydrogenase (short-subunit alcohol dehydrogenase family)